MTTEIRPRAVLSFRSLFISLLNASKNLCEDSLTLRVGPARTKMYVRSAAYSQVSIFPPGLHFMNEL